MSENNKIIHFIDRIQFTVFNNDDIKDYSSVYGDEHGINLPESYDNSDPKRGGLVDARLGVTDKNLDCAYCGLNDKYCPGHFGHTELVVPIFHVGFIALVKNILKCICLRSSKLLASDEKVQEINNKFKNKTLIFAEIRKISEKIKVSKLGIQVPKIKLEKQKRTGGIIFICEYPLSKSDEQNPEFQKSSVKDILTSSDVYNIFRNISDEDWSNMGFDHTSYRPEDLLYKNYPIPPVAIRPSIRANFLASSIYEDLLTHKLAEIIKTNEKLRKQYEKEMSGNEVSRYTNDLKNCLQYHITTFFENDKDTFLICESKIGNRPFKSISQRIKSKQGRIRGNLMGKRVNYSARTVITGDPNLKLEELGIPNKIAMELTFPEVVTPYNIDRLYKLVRNGRYIYPGANFVIQKTKSKERKGFDLRYRKKTIKLHYGDIVERHLIDGDPVLFNRQPSLHKLSMMSHKAKIIDDYRYSTLRMNVSACTPYNADFDGDEMNLHAPQSIQTQTELALLSDIKRHIITSKDCKPIIKPVQDAVLGSYLMTHPTEKIDWHDFMNLLIFAYDTSFEGVNKNKTYSGSELFSRIIPDNINITNKIKNGKLLNTIVNKKLNTNIVYNSWIKNDDTMTKNYIDNVQRLIINWILMVGFTVGLGDCYLNQRSDIDIIHKEIETKKLEINHLITEIENDPELLDNETFELSITSNLSAQKGDIQKIVMNSLDNKNNFYIMINSGSKGGEVNAMQIMGALGQDIFKNKRIEKDVNNRTLLHFHQNDDTPLARGYIEHSYFEGLSPQEFFFHHMSGREGIIDTAIKTADTGYISRRLMKALEDIGVKYDGLIRTGNNLIIQYTYGDNNIDQTKGKKVNLKTLSLGNKDLKSQYCLNSGEITKLITKFKLKKSDLEKFNDNYYNQLIQFRNNLRIVQKLYDLNYKIFVKSYQSPVDIQKIINDIIQNNKIKNNTFVNPNYILEQIEYIVKPDVTRHICISPKELKNDSLFKMKDEQISKLLFKYILYEYLSPKKINFEYNFDKNNFDFLVTEIINNYNKVIVNPGEMVGCIAAQHIGEVATQMTLNTFHATGSGSIGMQGVPRCEELIKVTKNIKTPIMNIYLNKDNYQDKKKALHIASKINYTIISDLIDNYDIIYDIDTNNGGYTEKDKTVNPFYVDIKTSSKKYENMDWLLKIVLNKDQMIIKNINLIDIKTKFLKFWKNCYNNIKGIKKDVKEIISSISSCAILSNYDNSDVPIIHIRFSLNTVSFKLLLNIKDWLFENIKLNGFEGIVNVNVSSNRLISFDEDKNIVENNEYVINTDGINFTDIKYLTDINLNKLYCNNVNIIYKNFGIEAARNALIKELNNVYNRYNVNYHHIGLLVDLICYTGKLTSVDRHGLNKLNRSPLTKASFEMPMDQLIKAATHNEIDPINSVSAQIMVGRCITGGTGLPKIMIDVDMIQRSEFIEDMQLIDRGNFIKLEENHMIIDIMNKDVEHIFMPTL